MLIDPPPSERGKIFRSGLGYFLKWQFAKFKPFFVVSGNVTGKNWPHYNARIYSGKFKCALIRISLTIQGEF